MKKKSSVSFILNPKPLLPPAARGSFYKNRPWTPQKFFVETTVISHVVFGEKEK